MTPPPLLVAVTGNRGRVAKVVASVKKQLLRRGLQVSVAQEAQRHPMEESDVVLIPCPDHNWKHLPFHLEQQWNEKWLSWYEQKQPPGGPRYRRRPKSNA